MSDDEVLRVPSWPVLAEPVPGHGTQSDRRWAVALHLSLLVGLVGVPLALALWKESRSPFVRHHAAQVLNFQTTLFLVLVGCAALFGAVVVLLLLPVLALATIGFAARGARAARRGAWRRYPWCLRVLS